MNATFRPLRSPDPLLPAIRKRARPTESARVSSRSAFCARDGARYAEGASQCRIDSLPLRRDNAFIRREQSAISTMQGTSDAARAACEATSEGDWFVRELPGTLAGKGPKPDSPVDDAWIAIRTRLDMVATS